MASLEAQPVLLLLQDTDAVELKQEKKILRISLMDNANIEHWLSDTCSAAWLDYPFVHRHSSLGSWKTTFSIPNPHYIESFIRVQMLMLRIILG